MHQTSLPDVFQKDLSNALTVISSASSNVKLQEALKFFQNLPPDIHWLATEGLCALLKACLDVFEIGGEALGWLKSKLREQFGRCWICTRQFKFVKNAFFMQRAEDYGFDEENRDSLLDEWRSWDTERLLFALTRIANIIKDSPTVSVKQLPGDFFSSIYECIIEPHLLEEPKLNEQFKLAFLGVQQNGRFLRMSEDIVPAMISFLCSPEEGYRQWAQKSFARLGRTIRRDEFSEMLQKELLKSLRLQLNAAHTRDGMSRLLRALAVLVSALSREIIIDFLCIDDNDMARLVAHQVLLIENGQIISLRCLTEFLKKLQHEFWDRVSPMIPFNTAEAILGSPKIKDLFEHPDLVSKLEPHAESSDITDWILPFVESIKGPIRQKIVAVLLPFLLETFQGPQYPVESRNLYLQTGLRSICILFEGYIADLEDFNNMNNIVRNEFRDIGNRFSAQIIAMSCPVHTLETNTDIEIQSTARSIVCNALELDCCYLDLQFTNYCKNKVLPGLIISDMHLNIWQSALNSLSMSDVDFCCKLVKGVHKASLIDIIDIKIPENGFNESITSVQGAICSILEKVTEFEAAQAKEVLKYRDCCITISSMLFSPCTPIYHANLNLLKQAYETSDKSEALKGFFDDYFGNAFDGLCRSMNIICNLSLFTPIPRLIKTCMVLLNILCSRTDGVLKDKKLTSSEKQSLQKLWKELWSTMRNVFNSTPAWSNQIDKNMMIDFMKDVIDLCELLMSSFNSIHEAISEEVENTSIAEVLSPCKPTKNSKSLLNHCAVSLRAIASWLRLNDDSLLRSCVNLVCSIIRKSARSEVEVNENTLDYLFGLAHHRKGFKNKLTEESSAQIIMAISELAPEARSMLHADTAPTTSSNRSNGSNTIQLHNLHQNFTDKLHNAIKHTQKYDGTPSKQTTSVVEISDNDFSDEESLAREMGIDLFKGTNLTSEKRELIRRSIASKLKPTSSRLSGKLGTLGKLRADLARDLREQKVSSTVICKQNAVALNRVHAINRKPKQPDRKDLSSSSSDSDSDSDMESLFSLPKPVNGTVPIIRKEKKTIIPLNNVAPRPSVQSKKQAQRAKAVRNAKARITPDLSPLYMRILTWDYNCDSELPPNLKLLDLKNVSNTFKSADEYAKTFEPLLLCEIWEQVRQAKEQKAYTNSPMCMINRSAVDGFVEIYASVSHAVQTSSSFSDPDLVLLSIHSEDKKMEKYCLAKVQGILRKKDHCEITLRCLPSIKTLESLKPKAELKILKLFNLTPIEREFSALVGLQYYDLCDEIIYAKSAERHEHESSNIKKTMECYRVNQPQALAILNSLKGEGFSLIQGPPGTGKTKTILGIVGSYLGSPLHQISVNIPGTVSSKPPLPKLLICAPSNAAVDEIVLRLKDGIYNHKGIKFTPKIIRIGRTDAVNASVRDVTLEELVDAELSKKAISEDKGPDIGVLREQVQKIRTELDKMRGDLEKARIEKIDVHAIEEQIRKLSSQRNQKNSQIDEQRERRANVARHMEMHRRQIQSKLLSEADVICATLSGSGHELLSSLSATFETVIIDEAAQSNELGALIPLKYGCQKCILVGDPNQLPPTILSSTAAKFDYQQSLFVRIQRNFPETVHLLSIQYRMHPEISQLPSKIFYESKLIDGEQMAKKTARKWHNSSIFGPYRFFNIEGLEQHAPSSRSVFNIAEVNAAIAIYDRLMMDFADCDFEGKIGIVTPYKQQLMKLKDKFRSKYGASILDLIDFNTVDGFQGQEKDIIILSCVRAEGSHNIGFLRDVRRMNVALTRAKSSLFILGNAHALERNDVWKNIVQNARSRNLCTNVTKATFSKACRVWETAKEDGEIVEPIKSQPEPIPLPVMNNATDSMMEKSAMRKKSTNGTARPQDPPIPRYTQEPAGSPAIVDIDVKKPIQMPGVPLSSGIALQRPQDMSGMRNMGRSTQAAARLPPPGNASAASKQKKPPVDIFIRRKKPRT